MQAPPLQPGQQPTPQQIQEFQRRFAEEAAKHGLTPQQFAERLRQQQMAQQQAMMAQQRAAGGQAPLGDQTGQPPSGAQPISQGMPMPGQPQQPQQVMQQVQTPGQGPANPAALAVAKFLKSQNLKARPCIFQEKRKELFKVKRAIRALQSEEYTKARKKNKDLPEISDRASAENAFKLLPLNTLAIRVTKVDAADNPAHGQPGHQHGAGGGKKQGGKKGLWNVQIVQQQDAADTSYYMWFYEGSNWKLMLYAAAALVAVVAAVLFPLWPYKLRVGVWYLSMASLGLLAGFFGLAIVRLILFLITVPTVPPGIWLYPNLFEDVGFFDSFRPVWAWRETAESLAVKKAEKKAKRKAKREKREAKANGTPAPPTATATAKAVDPVSTATATATVVPAGKAAGTSGAEAAGVSDIKQRAPRQATVEEVEDE